jgi:hypothetical protein
MIAEKSIKQKYKKKIYSAYQIHICIFAKKIIRMKDNEAVLYIMGMIAVVMILLLLLQMFGFGQ